MNIGTVYLYTLSIVVIAVFIYAIAEKRKRLCIDEVLLIIQKMREIGDNKDMFNENMSKIDKLLSKRGWGRQNIGLYDNEMVRLKKSYYAACAKKCLCVLPRISDLKKVITFSNDVQYENFLRLVGFLKAGGISPGDIDLTDQDFQNLKATIGGMKVRRLIESALQVMEINELTLKDAGVGFDASPKKLITVPLCYQLEK